MKQHYYLNLDEQVWWGKLPNGLSVAVIPRQGFSKKTAYLAVGAGSIHREFTVDGRGYTAPMGVAHYLEHKLFDMPGRDISAEFAALGASVNAFTSYDMTAYYFTCTDHFMKCLELLIEFVTKPYFTEESVEKEQGIIGQEIDMNEDAPETKVFENLTAAMYARHPVKEPILGTRETIAQITPQVLYDCHKAYYRPDNMLLCVLTDTDPREVFEQAEQMTATLECPAVTLKQKWQETAACEMQNVKMQMEVARPMFQIGFKCDPLGTGDEGVFRELVGDLAAETLFGESSELYLRLYEQGLIDPSFGGGLDSVQDMAMLSVTGDSDEPEKVLAAILEQAEKIVRDGIPQEAFMRMKRSILGGRIRGFDSFDSTCFRVCAYHFTDFDYFRFPQVYEKIQPEDVQEFIAKYVTQARACLSVIEPKEEDE